MDLTGFSPSRRSVASILRWRAGQYPDDVALHYEGRETSYADLDRRSNRVARALLRAGLKPGQHVCVLDKSHDQVFEVMFGVCKAGGVYTPVNWRLAAPEVAFILNDADAPVIFVGDAFADVVLSIESDLRREPRLVFWSDGADRERNYEEFLSGVGESDPHCDSVDQETAWQLYTSGTTGLPKGAELSHRNVLLCALTGVLAYGGVRSGDVALVCMPLYHIGGSGYALGMMLGGCKLIVQREAKAEWVLEAIANQGVHHVFLVPALINSVLQLPDSRSADLSSLSSLLYGASPIPEALLAEAMQRFDCKFIQAYGLTETSGTAVTLGPPEHWAGNPRLRACGKPLLGVELRIVDEHAAPCGPDQVGEIELRGDLIMKGYHNRAEATAEVFHDGWFRSGDAGYLDDEGYLYLHDRVKDMIVSGGENIYPAEVESAVFAHPSVADVAVIGVPDEHWGEAVKAVIVLKPGFKQDEADIIKFCRNSIAKFKCPKSIDFMEALPRNPTGKILKRELREPYWAGRDRRIN